MAFELTNETADVGVGVGVDVSVGAGVGVGVVVRFNGAGVDFSTLIDFAAGKLFRIRFTSFALIDSSVGVGLPATFNVDFTKTSLILDCRIVVFVSGVDVTIAG